MSACYVVILYIVPDFYKYSYVSTQYLIWKVKV